MARRSRKSRRVRLGQNLVFVLKISAVGVAVIGVCTGCFYAFHAGNRHTDSMISEIQLKRDFLGRPPDSVEAPESDSANAKEPARLTVDAMTAAAPLQVTDQSPGPLFGSPVLDSRQVDSRQAAHLAVSRTLPGERTRFQTPAAGRARANQAAWLTGNIESVQ